MGFTFNSQQPWSSSPAHTATSSERSTSARTTHSIKRAHPHNQAGSQVLRRAQDQTCTRQEATTSSPSLRTTHGTANGQRRHQQRRPVARKGYGQGGLHSRARVLKIKPCTSRASPQVEVSRPANAPHASSQHIEPTHRVREHSVPQQGVARRGHKEAERRSRKHRTSATPRLVVRPRPQCNIQVFHLGRSYSAVSGTIRWLRCARRAWCVVCCVCLN